MSTTHFYSTLSIHNGSLSDLLGNRTLFTGIPSDWHVIITDIKNSTRAFENGRHEEVNLIATGSIICTLNLAQKAGIQIPFFFGGDGATMIVPPELHKPGLNALTVHRENTLRNTGLDLRVGAVSVSSLLQAGHTLSISRLFLTDLFSIPVVLGDGLSEAEAIVKLRSDTEALQVTDETLDLTGMECRWDRIKPQTVQHEVVSLLVTCLEMHQQAPVYKRVFEALDRIYGPYEKRNPVSIPKLSLDTSFKKMALETRIHLGHAHLFETTKKWLLTTYGKWFYMNQKEGLEYLQELVQLTDTLVIDGRINTVIAGTAEQRLQLQDFLDALEQDRLIIYGLYTSSESVMSCYVQDRKTNHIHFVDGSDGGYTMAAKMMKEKVRRQRSEVRRVEDKDQSPKPE